MTTAFNYLNYSVNNKVALIRLDDGRMNTMSVDSVREWVAAIELANADDAVGAIVVTGAGRAFSAGADMQGLFLPKMRGEEPYDDDDHFLGGLALLPTDWTTLLRESKPVVAAFNGAAVGGGITAFLGADVLVASEKASFHFPFAKLGIVPELCSTRYLPARVGLGRASEILLSGRAVAAQEALDIGLVDYLFGAEEMLDEAIRIATGIAANPVPMLKMIKQLLDANRLEPDTGKVWRRESDALRQCFAMPEHKSAVENFLAKK